MLAWSDIWMVVVFENFRLGFLVVTGLIGFAFRLCRFEITGFGV